jgi:diamine N-acetyltransferase
MNISIATRSQLSIIKDLAYQIWPSAYGEILCEEQLDFMLDKFYDINALEKQMLEDNQVFLLIEDNLQFLGFCSYELNYENTQNTKLHKLYVLPETQGKGVGKLLLKKIENIAFLNNNKNILLNVNRFNKAQEFYKYQGYQNIETIDIHIGNGYLMEDYIMQKIIN